MNTSAELLIAVSSARAEKERHRLAYAYHLGWLVQAGRMSDAWLSEHHDEILEVAGLCRDERAAATGKSIAEADRLWGTVLERAADILRGIAV
ncbi:MAG: hypothetical protein ACYCXZ_06480 [Coriobacteriia bacterium]